VGLWSRLLRRREARSTQPLSFDDWLEFFHVNGTYYPFLRNSMSALDEETIGATLTHVAKSNGLVFALMLARMQVFSQARFQWTRFERGMPSDLWGTDELAVLERPWPGGTTADLLARMELDVTCAGNAFVRVLRRRGKSRLVCLRPEWTYIILGSDVDAEHPDEAPDVEVVGYAYKPPNGEISTFLPDEVAHFAPYPDPAARFLGMSWVTPAIRDVSADNLMTDHKRAFMRNAATPNVVVRFDPSITLKAVKEFKEFFEAGHRGVQNAYKTLFLGGGADVTVVGKDFAQLEFAATQGKGESRLASAAGVPPSWVGFSEGLQGSALNAGNFTAARRRFGDGTMQHLWANAAASLETILERPDDGAYLWFATKGIPFLRMDAQDAADVQAKEASTITALVRDGFTAESAIAAVQNSDWSLLRHTGMLSVQLQEPGAQALDGDQEGARRELLGGVS
jgi:Phage-related protein